MLARFRLSSQTVYRTASTAVAASRLVSMPLQRKRKMEGTTAEHKRQRQDWRQQLLVFRSSAEETLSFPDTLTNVERKEIHDLCRRYGLVSKSKGRKDGRVLTVSKSKARTQGRNEMEHLYQLPISFQSLTQLQKHLKRFPPSADEALRAGLASKETLENQPNLSKNSVGHSSRDFLKKRRNADQAVLSKSPKEIQSQWDGIQKFRSSRGQSIDRFRASLPAARYKDEILAAVAQHQVLLISGETGCGKTTQIPQFILDHAWENQQNCRILCTQPRRIAAIMVASRVAEERGEAVGKTVGYRVMLDQMTSHESTLIYATTGIMLKDLTNEPFQGEWTHLIIDEVHERDHNSDFLLVILRDLLPKHPQLKVILMSATLHKELFIEYFDNCPSLHIEGRTYPVQNYYLEDVLMGLQGVQSQPTRAKQPHVASDGDRAMVEASIEAAFLQTSPESISTLEQLICGNGKWVNLQHCGTGLTPLSVAVIHGYASMVERLLERGADPTICAANGFDCWKWASHYNRHSIITMLDASDKRAVVEYESPKNGDVDYGLLISLIEKICHERHWNGTAAKGSILVFLSGWKEITTMRQQLLQAGFGDDRAVILCLHSTIAPKEQKLAFQPAPANRYKIVLSTPIAETSITIDDVTVVINCGRMKEKSFDAEAGVNTLQSRWISKANETQRAGRAGRCQEGLAFHIYTRSEAEQLDEFIEPEICRISLEEICLQARVCLENYETSMTIEEFLQKAPNPPSQEAVEKAVTLLMEIGALNENQRLTVLGRRLASLPMDPRTGKMILYGILFNCLDPILTATCAISHRSPWVLAVDHHEEIKKIRIGMSQSMGGASDHLATVHAFNTWQKSNSKTSFCRQNFLSHDALYIMEGLRRKILAELRFRGMPVDNAALRENASDMGLVRSILACGLYPLVGCLKRKGRIEMKDRRVEMLGASVNSVLKVPEQEHGKLPECPLLAFEEITKGDFQVYVRDTTALQPHPLPLVASHLSIQDAPPSTTTSDTGQSSSLPKKTLVIDSWLHFVVDASVAEALAVLRIRLQDAFARKVLNPRNRMPVVLEDALRTIREYLSREANGGETGTEVQSPKNGFRQRKRSQSAKSLNRRANSNASL